MKWMLMAIIIFSSTPCMSGELSQEELPYLIGAFQTLLVDHGQTQIISNKAGVHESNMVLGEHPSKSDVSTYFAGVALLSAGLTYWLDDEYSKPALSCLSLLEMVCIDHNERADVDTQSFQWYAEYSISF